MNDTAAPILYLVSGLSGSGKSVALRTFEDLGFYCVDNLPAGMLADFVANVTRADEPPRRLAVGIDVRNRHTDLSKVPTWLSEVGRLGLDPRLVFFETGNEVLLRRFADTRRRHPLGRAGLSLADAIALERTLLRPLRALADTVIDTSDLIERIQIADTAVTTPLMFENQLVRVARSDRRRRAQLAGHDAAEMDVATADGLAPRPRRE